MCSYLLVSAALVAIGAMRGGRSDPAAALGTIALRPGKPAGGERIG